MTKQQIRFGGRSTIGLYLQTHPPATCAIVTDTLMAYLAFPAPVIINTLLLTPPIKLDGCREILIKPGESLPAELSAAPLLTEADGYRLYSIP